MICAKFGGNWPSSSPECNFKVSFMYFRILLLYHLEKHMKFYEFESLLQKNALCANSNWKWPKGTGDENLNLNTAFYLFCYYLPLEKMWIFIRAILISLHQKLLLPCLVDIVSIMQEMEMWKVDKQTDGLTWA